MIRLGIEPRYPGFDVLSYEGVFIIFVKIIKALNAIIRTTPLDYI